MESPASCDPRLPPPLMDELVEEVLLRLPANSPATLVRAGLVCKRWCHLVSDPGFQRRFINFHRRAPPMLGFLVHSHHRNDEGGVFHTTTSTRFVPTPNGSSLPHANNDLYGLRPCDSRHGRVLLHPYPPGEHSSFPIIVWNPITDEQLKLPNPPGWYYYHWTAAVLCAATFTGSCDHLDCHHGPFVVVLVGTTWYNRYTSIYSSEAGVWSKQIVAPHSIDFESIGDIDSSMRSTLVGNTLYFVLEGYRNILGYNLCTRGTSVVKLPRAGKKTSCERNGPIQLTTTEDGRLGLVRVEDYSRLCLWSREVEETGWVLSKVIDLHMLLPLDDRRPTWHYLVGSAEGVDIIFLTLQGELFTVDLRSGQATKVYTHQRPCVTKVVVPYVSFCTPVFRAPSTPDEPRTSRTSQSSDTSVLIKKSDKQIAQLYMLGRIDSDTERLNSSS